MRYLLFLLIPFLLYSQSGNIRPNTIQYNMLRSDAKDSLNVNSRADISDSLGNSNNVVKYYADTTAMKAETGTGIKQAYTDGSYWELITTAYSNNKTTAGYVVASGISGKQWRRVDYEHKKASWWGTSSDSTAGINHTAFSNLSQENNKIYFDKGNYLIETAAQISVDTMNWEGVSKEETVILYNAGDVVGTWLQIQGHLKLKNLTLRSYDPINLLQVTNSTATLENVKLETMVANTSAPFRVAGGVVKIYNSDIINIQDDLGATNQSIVTVTNATKAEVYIYNSLIDGEHYPVGGNPSSGDYWVYDTDIIHRDSTVNSGTAINGYDGNNYFFSGGSITGGQFIASANTATNSGVKITLEDVDLSTLKYVYSTEGTISQKDTFIVKNCRVTIDSVGEVAPIQGEGSHIVIEDSRFDINTSWKTNAANGLFLIADVSLPTKLILNNVFVDGIGFGRAQQSASTIQANNVHFYIDSTKKDVKLLDLEKLGKNSWFKYCSFISYAPSSGNWPFQILSNVDSNIVFYHCSFRSESTSGNAWNIYTPTTFKQCIFHTGWLYFQSTAKNIYLFNSTFYSTNTLIANGSVGNLVMSGTTVNKNAVGSNITVVPGTIYQTTNFYNSTMR